MTKQGTKKAMKNNNQLKFDFFLGGRCDEDKSYCIAVSLFSLTQVA